LVRAVEVLELLLGPGLLLGWLQVGVVPGGERPIGLGDDLWAGPVVDLQDLVVVRLYGHATVSGDWTGSI
jgi:hypothetical protein